MDDPGLFRGSGYRRTCATGQIPLTCAPVPPTARPPHPDDQTPRPDPARRPPRRPAVRADEGMWTFDNFPSAKVQKTYGFSPDEGGWTTCGCSACASPGAAPASFVSPRRPGDDQPPLRARCIAAALDAAAGPRRDGFYAKTAAEEGKCPEMEINQLIGITDVTARVSGATRGLTGAKFNEAQKAEIAGIEKECQTSDAAPLRRGHACTTAATTTCTRTAAEEGRAAGVRARVGHRLLRRRSRTTSTSPATTST